MLASPPKAMEELIEFKPATWLAAALLSVLVGHLCAALKAPLMTAVIPCTWLAYAVTVIIIFRRVFEYFNLWMEHSYAEIHANSLKRLSMKMHTGSAYYRAYQIETFFNSYTVSKTLLSRALWLDRPVQVATTGVLFTVAYLELI